MKTKLFLAGLLFLALIGCRRKSSDDYKYYQPAAKDTVKTEVPDTLANVDTTTDSTDEKSGMPEMKGVDLVNDHYFIVVASYAVEDFAKAQKTDLEAQGYKPEIFMIDDDGWFKLTVASYKTFNEAESALKKLKVKQDIFSTARIVFKKSKP